MVLCVFFPRQYACAYFCLCVYVFITTSNLTRIFELKEVTNKCTGNDFIILLPRSEMNLP